MHQIPPHRRVARMILGTAASFALLTGAVACKVVDRPIQIDHAASGPRPFTAPA